jgi:hypothetical protein
MNHPDFLQLADYWVTEAEDDDIEEHLFECAECTEALAWVAQFAKGVREVVRRGNLGVVLTPEFVERLMQDGVRVRTYAPPSGGAVQCTVTSQDDLLMGRLRADLSSAARVDALLCDVSGKLRLRIQDLPFRPEAHSELVMNQPIDAARQLGEDVLVMKLVDSSGGSDRLLAEYRFEHSPSAL